ncbi:hypothetical protein DB345_12630 [Spartobacteria bacterium LR76]|nr:hypothetical protein DB345_12630 [Spartobacteria bacterium LR76]
MMIVRLSLTVFLGLWLLFAPRAFAGENLVTNSGFENGNAPWQENNWLRNDARFELDPVNPHGGAFSYKMHFRRAIGGSALQFFYPQVAIKAGQTLKISYWARGISNGPPLHVILRKGSEPYTTYFRAESVPVEQWQEFSYTMTLPTSIDADNSQLVFLIKAPGQVWIDDVSITELPSVEEGAPPVVSSLRNGSFEVGRDGWTATFRERDFGTLWEESGSNSPSPESAILNIRSEPGTPHGRNFLSMQVDPNCRATLSSGYFPARYGHPMRLKFSLRSDGEKEFQVAIASGKNANTRFDGRTTLKATPQWKTYDVPVTLKAAPGGSYCIDFDFNNPGRYDLDAVSIVEADHPPRELFPASLAIEPSADAPAAHLYGQHQPARFRLLAAGMPPRQSVDYQVTAYDFGGHPISQQTVQMQPDETGFGETAFTVPTDRFGAFRLEARRISSEASGFLSWITSLVNGQQKRAPSEIAAEQIYSVLPALPPPAERPDSFFGGHVDFTSYNLEIARKGGFRWLRLYPPLSTLWMSVEHHPGQWNFRTEGADRARREGFRLLGVFATAPSFAADLNPKDPERPRWTRSYPPADLARWKEYVTRCFNAFHAQVEAWEVWNEPDGDYLRIRPGQDKAAVYAQILQATREALDASGKPTTLIGPALASINAPLGWEILEMGAGRFLDAFSFHFYSLEAGGGSPDTAFVTPLLARYRTFSNREGLPMPLWHTEGGAFLQGSQSWLETYRVPHSSSVTPSEAAASMVRAALYFKASGVKRYFDYQLGTSPAGRKVHEDITCGFIDVTGIPGPGIAAHAAMVALTEDASPVGFESRAIGDVTIQVARFRSDHGSIEACWSAGELPLSQVFPASSVVEVKDLMGNVIPYDQARVSKFPVYIRTQATP